MSTKRRHDLPARLVSLRQRFDRWRRTRKVRSRIPEPLWAAAVKLAAKCGIHQTAKALRVDYYALKKRVEQDAAIAGTQQKTAVSRAKAVTTLAAHQLQVLLSAGNPEAGQAALPWRSVGPVD